MAASVGNSLMAVSAFYIYKRSVYQVLDRLIEIHRKPPSLITTEEEDDEEDDQEQQRGFGLNCGTVINRKTTPSRSLDEKSLPNADMRRGGLIEEEAKCSSSVDKDKTAVMGK